MKKRERTRKKGEKQPSIPLILNYFLHPKIMLMQLNLWKAVNLFSTFKFVINLCPGYLKKYIFNPLKKKHPRYSHKHDITSEGPQTYISVGQFGQQFLIAATQ